MEEKQTNENNKGPIDYGNFFEENKNKQAQPAQSTSPVAENPVAKARNIFTGISVWWQTADKKIKIELVVMICCLILTITFMSLFLSSRKPKNTFQPTEANPAEFIPAEEIIQ